jgi:hypothetical protein
MGLFQRWFGRKREAPKAHVQLRELRGLMSCLVAWRRAALEGQFQDGAADRETFEEKRSALAWYVEGAGGVDPFATYVVNTPVGELEEGLFLEALYRIETAVGIAWALGLIEKLPPPEERADFEKLSSLFPVDAAPDPAIRDAKLRDPQEIAKKLEEWKALTAAKRRARDVAQDEATALPFSRAFERTRGLLWVNGETELIEDVAMDV